MAFAVEAWVNRYDGGRLVQVTAKKNPARRRPRIRRPIMKRRERCERL